MADSDTAVVRTLALRAAAEHDVEVVDVEHKGEGSRQLLRVTIDRKGGVPLEICQRLSRALSQALDEHDPVPGRYTLEVTSPGVDRPLTDAASFDRVEGRGVLVHVRGADGRVEQVRGTVARAGERAVEIDDGASRRTVPYQDIVKAAQTLPW